MAFFFLLLSRHYKVICLLISKAIFFFRLRLSTFFFGFLVADSPIPNSQNKLGGVCLCTSIDLCLTLCGICFPGNRPKCFNTGLVGRKCLYLFVSVLQFCLIPFLFVILCVNLHQSQSRSTEATCDYRSEVVLSEVLPSCIEIPSFDSLTPRISVPKNWTYA